MIIPMPVAEREHLARRCAAEVAPRLRAAIDRDDAGSVAAITSSLDRQALLALVVVLASKWPAPRKKQPPKYAACRACGNHRRHAGHGYCRGCHVRWDKAGRPEVGPPPPLSPEQIAQCGAARRQELKRQRIENYAELASWGVSDEEAAARLGVAVSTVREYKATVEARSGQLRIPVGYGLREAS